MKTTHLLRAPWGARGGALPLLGLPPLPLRRTGASPLPLLRPSLPRLASGRPLSTPAAAGAGRGGSLDDETLQKDKRSPLGHPSSPWWWKLLKLSPVLLLGIFVVSGAGVGEALRSFWGLVRRSLWG